MKPAKSAATSTPAFNQTGRPVSTPISRPADRYFRLLCSEAEAPLVEAMLQAQGYRFEPEPYWPLARRLTAEPAPLGGSLAARFGYIYIQDPSSMLPPLALNPAPGSAVLDMCASPGSKTGLLAQLAGPRGFVLGNEPSAKRLATLRRNLEGLNLLQCGTTTQPGEHIPLPGNLWDQIMLDPPCSGWGTVEKNPKVLELWQGEKVKPLVGLQRLLLREATRLLRPGGRLVYSTCTTNVEENEAQVDWAVKELGLEALPLEPFDGFEFAEPELPTPGVLRVAANSPRGQGFFIAALRKGGPAASGVTPLSGLASEGANGQTGGQTGGQAGGPAGGPVLKAAPVSGATPAPAALAQQALSPKSLDGPLADSTLLPPGLLAEQNGFLWFYPAPALEILPPDFVWRPFALGKATRNFRPMLALHALMPSLAEARKRGAGIMEVDDPAPVLALLSGQSLKNANAADELGLYFRGLPLCRLRNRGGRACLAK